MSLDVMRARVAFRDRAFLDVMDLALRFVVVHGRLYARVGLMALVPCIAITYGVALLEGWIAAWIVALVLAFVAQVPFTVLASRVVFQENVRAREVLRAALGDIPRVLVMRVLWTAMVALAGLLVLAPAAWVASVFGFTSEVMLLERAPIGQALARSNRVASSALPDALLALALAISVPALALLGADYGGRQLIGELFQFRAPAAAWSEGGSFLAVLGWFAAAPYVATARFFVYLNVRTRVEGWDVQTRFAVLAARAEQPEAA